jgi:hypothetical protein
LHPGLIRTAGPNYSGHPPPHHWSDDHLAERKGRHESMTDVHDQAAPGVKPSKGMARQLLPVAEQDPERLFQYGIDCLEDFNAERDPAAALARAAGAQAWFLAALARWDRHIAGREQQARCVVYSGEVFGDTADEIEVAAATVARQVAGVGPRVPVRPDGPYNLNQVPPDPSPLAADTDRNRDLRRRACGKGLWARIAMAVYREAEED